jgi:hypothetical protein
VNGSISGRKPVTGRIYDGEINVRISWLWDGGIELWLGDEVSGFLAEERVESVAECSMVAGCYGAFLPTSPCAESLSSELRRRAAIQPAPAS